MRALLATSLLSLTAFFACGGGTSPADGGAAACPDDTPSSCTSAGSVPSYAADVAPVLAGRCETCHAPGGQEASLPLQTYAQVFRERTTLLSQLHACRMPPAGASPLSSSERAVVQTWLVCGAPDN